MSLRSKIALVLFLAVAVFVGADLFLRQATFRRRFEDQDAAQGMRSLDRFDFAVSAKVRELNRARIAVAEILGDATGWSEDPTIVAAGVPKTIGGLPIHLLLAYDAAGKVHAYRIQDPASGDDLRLRLVPRERLAPNHPFLRGEAGVFAHSGLFVTERGAILLSSDKCSIRSGESIFLTVGRFLDEGLLNELRGMSGVSAEIIALQGGRMAEEHQRSFEQAEAAGDRTTELDGQDGLVASAILRDLSESPALLVRARASRDHIALWEEMSRYTITSTIAVAVIYPFVILLLLQWIVTGPLSRLTAHVVRIGRANDTQARLGLRRGDEIGQLADEFDSMLEKLANSRAEVVRNARLAGRSEVSSGVLHNLGNVLNSIKVAAHVAAQRLGKVPTAELADLSAELAKHGEDIVAFIRDDSRGRNFLPYLQSLVGAQRKVIADAQGELDGLTEDVALIEGLISSLRTYDSRLGVVEELDLAQQVDAVVELCLRSHGPRTPVAIERDYANLPTIHVDRNRLMEVLVNVVLNALQAIDVLRDRQPRLWVRIAADGRDAVRIEIRDNGVGIDSRNLSRIFALGFSTKPGERGLGLHLASTIAGEMGASLEARSEGEQRGATFVLRLPRHELPSCEPLPAPSRAHAA